MGRPSESNLDNRQALVLHKSCLEVEHHFKALLGSDVLAAEGK
jgi:hypothetical protein